MKAVGLITEYNPMHNGHLYHISEAKKISGADLTIAVMSGNYVQRGEPSIIDKYSKTKIAMESGIDLVIELPAVYSLLSAEGFAKGAVGICNHLYVDSIVFGSESGDINQLDCIASLLVNESEEFKEIVRKYSSQGESYASSRQLAVKSILGEQYSSLLSDSNNILGIEYLKAVKTLKYDIKTYTIKREGSEYNDENINKCNYSSATSIRNIILNPQYTHENIVNTIKNNVPNSLLNYINESFKPVALSDYSDILSYRLTMLLKESEYNKDSFFEILSKYPDVNRDISNAVFNQSYSVISGKNVWDYEAFAANIRSKNIALSRVKRILMRLILGLDNNALEFYKDVPYIRILGFNNKGRQYLSELKKKTDIPLIIKTADYKKLLNYEFNCCNIYNNIVYSKYKTILSNEYNSGPVIIDKT
ncbi:MAG: nucleotidyltransferase [Eubacteriales bacterium]|nr:nucleotidyltransferase [Eubacteriales bacterium]